MPPMQTKQLASATSHAVHPVSGAMAFRPMFQPSNATYMMLGPGAACAMAMESENWWVLSQPCCSTVWRYISGAVAIAPPTESRDSDR